MLLFCPGVRPGFVSASLPSLAARDPLPHPLDRRRISPAIAAPLFSLLGTVAPSLVDATSNLLRGVPGCSSDRASLVLVILCGAPELHVLAEAALSTLAYLLCTAPPIPSARVPPPPAKGRGTIPSFSAS